MKNINQIQAELEVAINNLNALRQEVTELQSQPAQEKHEYYFTQAELIEFVRLIVNDCEQGAKNMVQMCDADIESNVSIEWQTNENVAEALLEFDTDAINEEYASQIDFDTDIAHITGLAESMYDEIIMNRMEAVKGTATANTIANPEQ